MSTETERRVVAALMILGHPKNLEVQEAMLFLHEDYFYNPHLKNVFKIIHHLFTQGNSFNALTVNELVHISDHPTCSDIISNYVSASNLIDDGKHLKQTHLRNQMAIKMQKLSVEFNKKLLPLEACNTLLDGCYEISKMGIHDDNHVFAAETMADKFLLGELISSPIIPSGIQTLDSLNDGGFKEGSLITIAGRSGMGKTSFGVHLARQIALNHPDKHVLFFSLEMTPAEIFEKQITSSLGKHPFNLTKEEKHKSVVAAMNVPFTINAKPLATIDYIETSSRITHIKTPISVIVVDYLGIVQNRAKLETHVLRQADISLRLAALALELNCIVIALTQVNRDYSSRDDKCPITSDAADSSGSERSSSYWLGIHRPEIDSNDPGYLNQFVVKCRKNRFGKTWKAVFAFDDATFKEIDQRYFYEPKAPEKGIHAFMKSNGYKKHKVGEIEYD